MTRRAAGIAAIILLAVAVSARGQSLVDRFESPPSSVIPNWSVEFGGDWQATGTAAQSDTNTGWQFLLRDSVTDRDCVVEGLVRYDGPSHLQFAGPMARTTIEGGVLRTYLVKSQDNSRYGTGAFNTGYIYYYESPLVFVRLAVFGFLRPSTLIRTRMLVMDEPGAVRIMGYWDLDLDGVWDHRIAVLGSWRLQETGGVGLNGFSRCFADEWRYFDACLYARNPDFRPGETLELVARGRPDAVYLAGSSFFNTGIPVGGGKAVPLYPDALLVLSRSSPAIFQDFTGVLNADGDAVLRIAVPNEPALVGTVFYTAFLTLSATNPGRVDEVSNDEQARIVG